MILIRLFLVYCDSISRYTVIAIQLTALHSKKLGIVFLHIKELSSLKGYGSAPVFFVLSHGHISLRLELFDNEGACTNGIVIEIFCSVYIHHSK